MKLVCSGCFGIEKKLNGGVLLWLFTIQFKIKDSFFPIIIKKVKIHEGICFSAEMTFWVHEDPVFHDEAFSFLNKKRLLLNKKRYLPSRKYLFFQHYSY